MKKSPISITATATEIRATRPPGMDPQQWRELRQRTVEHLDKYVAGLRSQHG